MTSPDLSTRLGQPLGVSDWMEITQERVKAFADATGDHQFIHLDPARAAETPFGGTIAHGYLMLSLLAGPLGPGEVFGGLLGAEPRMLVNYGLNRVRFVTPVRVGARVRSSVVLAGVEEGQDYLQFTLSSTVEIEGEARPALVAESLVRAYR